MAGPIDRQDLVTDEGLSTIPKLTDQLTVLLQTIDMVKTTSKAFADGLGAAPLPKLKQDVDGLTQAQVEYAKIMNQVATINAKNNDLNIAASQTLKNAKDDLKNAQATADGFTKSVTAQNSSIIQLNDALNKNRIAYSSLKTDAERNTKSGKELLDVIVKQDVSYKALTASMGQNQARVGGYREEIEKLLPAMRSFSPVAAEAGEAAVGFGTKLLAIVASPITIGLAAIVAGLLFVKTAVETFFERTIEGEDAAARVQGNWTALVEITKDKFADLGKSISNALGLQDNAAAGIIYMTLKQLGLNDAADKYLKKVVEINKLTDLQIKQRKEELTIGIEITTKEEEKNKAIFESRQKLDRSDEDRLALVKQAQKALNDEIDLKLKKNALEQKIAEQEKQTGADNYAAEQKIAGLKVAAIRIDAERYTGQHRLQAEEVQISRDIITKRIEAEKQYTETTLLNATTIVNAEIAANQKILNSTDTTLEDKLKAQHNYTEDLIKLNAIAAQKEVEAARSQRDTQLGTTPTDDYERQSQILQAFIDKQTAILGKAQQEQLIIIRDGGMQSEKVIADDYLHRLEIQRRFNAKDHAQELHDLSDKFNSGNITIAAYTRERTRIIAESTSENADISIEYYKEELSALEKFTSDEVKVTKEYAALVAKLNDAIISEREKKDATAVAKTLKLKQAENQALIQLQGALFSAVQQIVDNGYLAEQNKFNDHIQELQNESQKELDIAGDNANAKKEITRRYNAEILDEQKKVKKSQHDQAVFDRNIAIVQIIANTAEAVMKAYGELGYVGGSIVGAILSGIGTAEIAAITSKPIPSYEFGTTNHPGGPARVSDGRGSEIVMEPGRAPRLYDVPNTIIPNLAPGSKVFTAEESAQLINNQMVSTVSLGSTDHGGSQVVVVQSNKDIVDALYETRQPDLIAQMHEIMKVTKLRDGGYKHIRGKIFWGGQ